MLLIRFFFKYSKNSTKIIKNLINSKNTNLYIAKSSRLIKKNSYFKIKYFFKLEQMQLNTKHKT